MIAIKDGDEAAVTIVIESVVWGGRQEAGSAPGAPVCRRVDRLADLHQLFPCPFFLTIFCRQLRQSQRATRCSILQCTGWRVETQEQDLALQIYNAVCGLPRSQCSPAVVKTTEHYIFLRIITTLRTQPNRTRTKPFANRPSQRLNSPYATMGRPSPCMTCLVPEAQSKSKTNQNHLHYRDDVYCVPLRHETRRNQLHPMSEQTQYLYRSRVLVI